MLDVPTLLFMVVLTNGLLAASLWVGIGPGARHGVGRWTLALALTALLYTFLVVRGPAPGPASIIGVNVLGALSLTLQLDAILLFYGQRLSRWWAVLAPLALTPVLGLFAAQGELRVAVAGILFGGVMAAVAGCANRLHTGERRLGNRLLVLGYLVAATALALRAATALVRPAAYLGFRGEGMVAALSGLVAFVVTLMTSFGFLLMHRERTEEQVAQLAMLDPLTGVFNRRSFFDLAERALSQALRHSRPLSLVLLDLDHFKRINDTHGHLTGDGVLKHFVAVVQAGLRKGDLLSRYGGEEFCVLLPDAAAEDAGALAERLRAAVEASPYRGGDSPVWITISAGVASVRPSDQALTSVVQRADAGLYAAKREGRNRVVLRV
jgi:diguanylate cyclase (GGDEF)-like protein